MAKESGVRDYEALGSFYLGRQYDLPNRKLLPDKVLIDAKDLTTHAMCVGMTGSGKTGLCLALLEEAAIDGIPAICVDPKGDLGNLLLSFPNLADSDFEEWVEPAEAARQNMDKKQYAEKIAKTWREGLESWDQGPDRIRKFRDTVDIAIYTPGSNAGIPMTVLKSFDAPPQVVLDDAEVMRERVAGSASGLLALLGITADPLTSREHILLSSIFDQSWRQGRNLSLPDLIRSIQNPPFDKVGVFDLESFFSAAERFKLAMSLNNLLASPSFAGWLEGQALDIRALLHTKQGKPRLSIISIAHLDDSERMFFVTILLNELISWMRTQPGTNSLRALFYMDEVFGYFPPTAKPPSKPPMLTLLKQARAFGLGIALATQNPVDLDYKGLSNIGMWFLGRLQTQRDKERVLEGLEGAAIHNGSRFDRGVMEQTLAALGSRVFLMNNVHDDGPTIFQSRWAMSYLRGPLSRDQIKSLMDARRDELDPSKAAAEVDAQADVEAATAIGPRATSHRSNDRPIVPNGIEERFWLESKASQDSAGRMYRAGLLANVACHYVRASADLDEWIDKSLVVACEVAVPDEVWEQSRELPTGVLQLGLEPREGFRFDELPGEMLNKQQYTRWQKELRDYLYRHASLRLFRCKELKTTSRPGQDELDARLSWEQEVREKRDEAIAELRARLSAKRDSLVTKIRTAEQRVAREQAQYDNSKWKTAVNFGETLLGAFLGRKVSSRTASTGRGIGRAAQQRTDVLNATDTLNALFLEKHQLEAESEREIDQLKSTYSVHGLTLEPLDIPCRKSDTRVDLLALVWIPWQVQADSGLATPLVDLPA